MNKKRKSAAPECPERYNPCHETANEEQVAAAHWELLRRISAFQDTSKQWIASAEFRHQHVLEAGPYKANDPARCALDWMLTPDERLTLAEFQKSHRLLFPPDRTRPDLEWNFGPLLVEWNWEAHKGSLNDSSDTIVHIRSRDDSAGCLTLEMSWREAPPRFKSQFRQSTSGSPTFKQLSLQEIGVF